MNRGELRKRLVAEKIRPDSYCLDGGFPNEAYCLSQNGLTWEVYYSERGQKAGLNVFSSEEAACEDIYNTLVKTLKSMGLL